MFSNCTILQSVQTNISLAQGSDTFNNFLSMLGENIQLEMFNGYRGDMGKSGESIYTKWNGFESNSFK